MGAGYGERDTGRTIALLSNICLSVTEVYGSLYLPDHPLSRRQRKRLLVHAQPLRFYREAHRIGGAYRPRIPRLTFDELQRSSFVN